MGKNRSTAPAEGQVKARVLTSCSLGEVNDVITMTATEAAGAVGLVDTSPESVAYAESLVGPAE